MKVYSLTILSLICLALSGCASASGLTDLTRHLNERGCATQGSATASAGITGASLGGNVAWKCLGAAPLTGEPQPDALSPISD